MTDSRETMRRRSFRERQELDKPPAATKVDLSTLCVIQGCLRPRHGTNLCRSCEKELDP